MTEEDFGKIDECVRSEPALLDVLWSQIWGSEDGDFWDVPPSNLAEVHCRFGGTYRIHFQNRRVNQTTWMQNLPESNACLLVK